MKGRQLGINDVPNILKGGSGNWETADKRRRTNYHNGTTLGGDVDSSSLD